MTQTYTGQYHQYPVLSEEMSYEGALKRFSPMPTPDDVFNFALMGISKVFPLTGEPITPELAKPHLESAITDIEMDLGFNVSPIVHFQSCDYIDGMMAHNYIGIKLQKWPATEIIQVQLKFPHTNTQSTYQRFTFPPSWIYLRRNRVNIVASMGAVNVSVDNTAVTSAGGIFTYLTGYARGAWAPGAIEIVYKAGFEQDKMPNSLVDLIKTWAAARFLSDIAPTIYPNQGVSVGIDGVSQSVSFNISQMLLQRIESLNQRKKELAASIVKAFGRTAKMSFVGA